MHPKQQMLSSNLVAYKNTNQHTKIDTNWETKLGRYIGEVLTVEIFSLWHYYNITQLTIVYTIESSCIQYSTYIPLAEKEKYES